MIDSRAIPGKAAPGAVWVDLCKPDADDLAQASQRVGFEIPGKASISEIEFTSRVRRVGDTLFLNLPRYQEGGGGVAPLGFAISPHALVTQRELPLTSLETIASDLDRRGCDGPVDLFLRIVEHIVDRIADRLEALEAQVTETTRHVFDDRRRARGELNRALLHVGGLGRRLGAMHNNLLGLLRIVNFLDEATPPWFGDDGAQRLKLIHKDLASLGEFEQQLGDRVEFLLDGTLGLINVDQNDVMKVMAVASVVGIPPTVLVGIWGMNFAFMPELPWRPGYFVALAVIGLSIAVPLLWFRRKGWV